MNLKALFSVGALIAVGMIIGRVLGLLREILLASQFGIHAQADTAIMLLMIPDFVTSALIGGAASATFVPAFIARKPEDALALLWQALAISTGVFTVIAVCIGIIGAHSTLLSAVPLALAITLCSLPLSAATAVVTAYLQHRERFLAPAFANAIFNAVIILTLWMLPANLSWFAGGILVAVLARFSTHVGAFVRVAKAGAKPIWGARQLDRRLLNAYLTTVSTSILGLLPFYVPYAVIAGEGSGIALFNYAFKLVLLPVILLQTFSQMVLLPWFAKHSKESTVSYSLTLQVIGLTVWVATLVLFCTAPSLALLCFNHGQMTAEEVEKVSWLFTLGVWAIVPSVLASVLQQMLYAKEHTRAALHGSVMQAILVLPLCWGGYKLAGLPGVMIAYGVMMAVPLWSLVTEGKRKGMLKSFLPARVYWKMMCGATLAFVLLAGGETMLRFTGPDHLLLISMVGMIALAAGLFLNDPVRVWIIRRGVLP